MKKLNKMTTQETVSALLEQKNSIEAQIYAIENGMMDKNSITLYEEICNLIDQVGDFYPEDYYADSRVYSKIPGVKNLRFERWDNNSIIVKLYSCRGHILPSVIKVRGEEYSIKFEYSEKYQDGVDY